VRPRAAGATWGPVTDHAPWAARAGHTTVIDAAGNIYLMGGGSGVGNNPTIYNDVWVYKGA
jgi:hypothetical protein